MRPMPTAVLLTAILCNAASADEPSSTKGAPRRIERLIEQLESSSFEKRESASKALAAIGPAALPALRAAAVGREAEVRRRARRCIEDIERNERVRALIAQMKALDPQARAQAIDRLREFQSHATPAVPALTQAIDDKDQDVRLRAVVTVGLLGSTARDAVPRLRRLLNDDREDVKLRTAAAKYLGMMGQSAECAVPDLLRLLDVEPLDIQVSAVYALGHLGQDHPEVIPALLKALDRDRTCGSAAWALGRLRKEPRRCLPALLKALGSNSGNRRDDYVQDGIIWAIGQFGRDARAAIPAVAKVASDTNVHPSQRCRAIESLENIGPDATKALVDLTKSPDPRISGAATRALQDMARK